MLVKRFSMDFGKKEKVLNYASNNYQLTRPAKVGEVMALIRECQPGCLDDWEEWYFKYAHTKAKISTKITRDSLAELGERLFEKITQVVIPEWQTAFQELTKQDCLDYIYNLVINRTYDGFIREKSVVNDTLAKLFSDVRFVESDPETDHACDIDYLGWVGNYAFGIQIKPLTNKANFGNYKPSERMQISFKEFENQYGGKVFIIYSLNGEIGNNEVVADIRSNIIELNNLGNDN